MERKIITTADGSPSLFVPELNEHYHSTHGAINESQHVFIKNGLQHLIESGKKDIEILEVGFGTGLNTLLSCLEIEDTPTTIRYTGIEAFPLEDGIIQKLNYADILNHGPARAIFTHLHSANWEEDVAILPDFLLRKVKTGIHEYVPDGKFDLVYFDAFAPNVQPEMWDKKIFSKLFSCMNEGASLVTYCAKGEVRRTMVGCGFKVERLPGPPYKREMLRATR